MKIVYNAEIYEDLLPNNYVYINEIRKDRIEENYCCLEMENKYGCLIKYVRYDSNKWGACIDINDEYEPHVLISHCPWCGEKIEIIGDKVIKFKRKEIVKVTEVVEKVWEPVFDP